MAAGKDGAPIVSMRDIVKIYPDGTVALRGVSLDVYPGEILGLLGENGAGKTTLMKILSGFLRPTSGYIILSGRRVSFRSAADALAKGIGMVHQHLALVPVFTGYENIVLGLRHRGDLRAEVERLMEETGLHVKLDVPVEQLSFGERQRIEILRMLLRRIDILILDEPTTNLTPLETRVLFNALRRLRDSGKSVIFITHKLREVMEVADRIVVMRRGRVVGELPRSEAEPKKLARMMVGREVFLRIEKPPAKPGEPVLQVMDLWVRSDTGGWAVKGVSFEVHAGEIFGIAGVEGNGQAELVQAITGLRRVEKGRIILGGKDVTNAEPSELYRMGLAHIPEDRQAMGLVLDMSVAENSILGMHRWRSFMGVLGSIRWRSVYSHAERIIREYEVVAPSIRSPVRYLSGGNQQKLLAGRELSKNPRLVIAAQPTRGLDVAATEYIRKLLVDLRTRGHAVLLVSADTDEVLQLSDRVAVMYNGRFTAVTRPEELTEEKLGLLMGGMEAASVGRD